MALLAQTLVNGVMSGGLYALLAIGLTLVFGVMRIVNFAHGEFVMLAAYLVYVLFADLGIPPHYALLPVMLAMALVGALVQRTVIEPVLEAPHLNQIVVTFALATIMQNAALLLWTADLKAVRTEYASLSIALGPLAIGVGRLLGFVLAVTLTALLYVWLYFTETGRSLRAVSQNRRVAMLMGIDVRRAYYTVFAVAAAIAAAAGAISAVTLFVSPYLGYLFVLKAFAIVILGGLGSVHGAIVASVLLGCGEAFVSTYVPGGAGWSEAVAFAVIIIVLLVRPTGLFGAARG